MNVNWNDATIFEGNPLFSGNEDYPLSLMNGSPCIDAGTLEYMPDFQPTTYDAAGNPRIYGESIDMGAYEWQGTGVSQEYIVSIHDDVVVYPNPLIAGSLRDGMAKILWSGEDSGEEIYFEIFNIKGQRIYKCKIENVKCKIKEVSWDLCDDGGNPVSSGIYFIRVKSGADYLAQKKLTVVN
jgi:hypothetical protein